MKAKIKTLLAGILMAFILAPSAHALQIIGPIEGQSMFVDISQVELNMINFPVAGIRVNTSSPDIDIKVNGRQIMVNMINKNTSKPQEVFFTTPYGTYLLMLVPKKIPAEMIMVQIDRAKTEEAEKWELESDYVKRLKELIKALYARVPPGGYSADDTPRDVSRWQGIEETTVMTMTGAGLSGEVREITNHSDKTMRMVEQEFYREGVLAVTLLRHELKPGEKGEAFLILSNFRQDTPMGRNVGRPLEMKGR